MDKSLLKERIEHKIEHNSERTIKLGIWIIFAVIIGIILGLIGAAFVRAMQYVTFIRTYHWYVLLLLPVGAVVIKCLYSLCGYKYDGGTSLVLSAIHSGDRIPLRMTPLIFISTIISHLCGASIGREGAALQMGGSVGAYISRLFRFKEHDTTIMIMCGMSAAFSAVFGTPMAAAIFSMEVVSVGIMHYAALVPCVVASFTARAVAGFLGVKAEVYDVSNIPTLTPVPAIEVAILASLCGLVSILFCISLRTSEMLYQKLMPNVYLRAFIGGTLILILTALVGSQTYNGTGINFIRRCIDGYERPEAFLLKIAFTALTIAAGYKGGEIVPSFFIGASFGSVFGSIIGLSPSMCAAVGLGSVFCGVTNSPITSLLICLELFGMEGMPYYLIAVAFSYAVSGYYSLYTSQRIVYSKYKSNYINKKTH